MCKNRILCKIYCRNEQSWTRTWEYATCGRGEEGCSVCLFQNSTAAQPPRQLNRYTSSGSARLSLTQRKATVSQHHADHLSSFASRAPTPQFPAGLRTSCCCHRARQALDRSRTTFIGQSALHSLVCHGSELTVPCTAVSQGLSATHGEGQTAPVISHKVGLSVRHEPVPHIPYLPVTAAGCRWF